VSVAELGDGGDVDGVVDGAVPAPGDVTDLAYDDRGDHVADPEDIDEAGARGSDGMADPLTQRLALAGQSIELIDEVDCQQVSLDGDGSRDSR
jgi:hypothetical protein